MGIFENLIFLFSASFGQKRLAEGSRRVFHYCIWIVDKSYINLMYEWQWSILSSPFLSLPVCLKMIVGWILNHVTKPYESRAGYSIAKHAHWRSCFCSLIYSCIVAFLSFWQLTTIVLCLAPLLFKEKSCWEQSLPFAALYALGYTLNVTLSASRTLGNMAFWLCHSLNASQC